MSKKIKVDAERDVITYTEFLDVSSSLLKMTDEFEEDSYCLIMGSLVFTAFTFEAYLNHIGSKVYSCWNDLERLNPTEKLNVISEKIGLKVNYGISPWQSITELFRFRNDIAHGKSLKISCSKTESFEEYHKFSPLKHRAETKWEKYCTKTNAEKARQDVKQMIFEIHTLANIEDELPFQMGLEVISGSVLSAN